MAPNEREILMRVLYSTLAGTTVGLLIGSILNALWLLLANAWVGAAQLSYGKAFRAVLATNFVLLMFGLVIGLGIAFVMVYQGHDPWRGNLYSLLNPVHFIYFTVGSVLLHATIFAQMLEGDDGRPLRFGKASALALVYLGICVAFSFLLAVAAVAVTINANVQL